MRKRSTNLILRHFSAVKLLVFLPTGPAPEMREHGARGPVGYQPTIFNILIDDARQISVNLKQMINEVSARGDRCVASQWLITIFNAECGRLL